MGVKSTEEVELLRKSSLLVSDTLAVVASALKSGVNGFQLDKLAEEFIRDNGGEPAFKGYRGFPYTLCISPNNAVVHGMPTAVAYKEGDVVSVDCGVKMNGYYGDSAFTFLLNGKDVDAASKLLKTTRESLHRGISKALAGNRVGDIGYEIQSFCESFGYTVVRELVGHGLGTSLHEEPEVPNYGQKGKGAMLKDGIVIAIEPMINQGKKDVVTASDKWTVITKDNKLSAHFEHTIVVRKEQAEMLSDFERIDKQVKNNNELVLIV